MESINRLREYVENASRMSISLMARATLLGMVRDIEQEVGNMVPMPVDADGVPIHVGDVMEFTYDPPQDQPLFEVSGFGADGTLFYAARGEVAPRKVTNATVVRHHHAPTVEDVLREFADRVCNSGHQWGLDAADTIAEYAAKLRLAGEDA